MDFLEKAIVGFVTKFSKDIQVDLNPELVVFYRENRTIQRKPVIYVEKKVGKPKLLGFGDDFYMNENHLRIDVFDFKEVETTTSLDPQECLTAFFRSCIRDLTGLGALVKPRIIVRNIDSLRNLLPENTESVVETALIESGARECVFVT